MKNTKLAVRVKSALKLSAYLAILGVIIFVFRGWDFFSKCALVASAFFLVVGGLEFWASKPIDSKQIRPLKKRETSVLKDAVSSGFRLVETEGDIWRERIIEIDNHQVTVRLPGGEKDFGFFLPFAQKLIDDPHHIATAFKDFKYSIKSHIPSEDYDNFTIEAFEFFSRKHPEIAEVTFKPVASGRFFVAVYSDGRFSKFSEET